MQSKGAASWRRLSLCWAQGVAMSDPAVLNHARLVAVGLAGVAAVAGFILLAIMLASLPFVFLGGLGLIITAVLVVSVSGFVAIGGTFFFLARSEDHRRQGRTRISDECACFLGHPMGFAGTSLQVLRSSGMY